MATLNWIAPTCRSPFLRRLDRIPFIIGDDGAYLDGPNFYLQERCSGKISLKHRPYNQVAVRRLSRQAVLAIGHRLTNFASWLYCIECHPSEGVIDWADVAAWHIDDLYREQMVLGYWGQEYWASGNKFSLSFSSTIRPRLAEAKSCCDWMANQGLSNWPKPEPELYVRQHAAALAEGALIQAIPKQMREKPGPPRYRRRLDPGDWSPLTPEELRAIIRHIRDRDRQLAVLLYLATGMRLNELVENTLVPGTMHTRTPLELNLSNLNFPRQPYALRYDLNDNRMLGVLPDAATSFASDRMLPYRIIGKGNKIRRIYIPSKMCRDLWRHHVVSRRNSKWSSSPYMLLNKDGRKLAAWNISYSISKARKAAERELGTTIAITAHVLRHTYACLFIEAVISSRAAEEGIEPTLLSQEHIERFGTEALAVLQELLGHTLPKDTARYLRQLSMGRVGLRYLECFQASLRDVVGENAAF